MKRWNYIGNNLLPQPTNAVNSISHIIITVSPLNVTNVVRRLWWWLILTIITVIGCRMANAFQFISHVASALYMTLLTEIKRRRSLHFYLSCNIFKYAILSWELIKFDIVIEYVLYHIQSHIVLNQLSEYIILHQLRSYF